MRKVNRLRRDFLMAEGWPIEEYIQELADEYGIPFAVRHLKLLSSHCYGVKVGNSWCKRKALEWSKIN